MKRIAFIIVLYILLFINLPVSAQTETLIIFDASVSMLEQFDGMPKYINAVNQAKEVLKTFPNSEKIGLRTIGVSVDSALIALIQNPSELCKSTRLVVPITQNSINKISSTLDNIFPLGTTPLEYALRLAVNYDFVSDRTTKKHIILVTDGADSCNGDPCKYIRELMSTRKDIVIDIIAIGVNAEDFKQLNCISSMTSGSLVNVQTSSEINSAFKTFLKPSATPINVIKNNSTKYKNFAFMFYD